MKAKSIFYSLMAFVLLMPVTVHTQISFTADVTEGCAPLTVNFTNTSSEGDYYIWHFNDGSDPLNSFDASHTFENYGGYGVYINAYDDNDNFVGTFGLDVFVINSNNDFIINSNPVCPEEEIFFGVLVDYPYFISASWDFGDGNSSDGENAEHAYSDVGEYDVTLISETSCGIDTIIKTITVLEDAPIGFVYFGLSESVICPGDQFFYWCEDFLTHEWDFGDGFVTSDQSGLYGFDELGTQTIALTVTNGCGNDTTVYTTLEVVNDLPMDDELSIYLNTYQACPGDEIHFYPEPELYSSYSWDFGDGIISDTQYAVHVYNEASEYEVELTITNGCGFSSSTTEIISIEDNLPVEDFEISIWNTPACPGDFVHFLSWDNNYVDYEWDLGNGESSTDPNTYTSYDAIGDYDVSLTVTNGCGSTGTMQGTVEIEEDVYPNTEETIYGVLEDIDVVCPGDSVIFFIWFRTDAECQWDFGDGNSTSDTEMILLDGWYFDLAKHAYEETGDYIATLTTTNGCGNSATYTVPISVVDDAPATGGVVCLSGEITVGEPAHFAAFGGSSYEWNWGDGSDIQTTAEALVEVEHVYDSSGIYTVELTVINSCGNSSTYECDVSVVDPVSIEEINLENLDMIIYPNPSEGIIVIDVSSGRNQRIELSLYSIDGKFILGDQINSTIGDTRMVLDLNNQESGLYILEFTTPEGNETRRIVIQ